MRHKHYCLAFAALAVLTLVSLLLSVCIGSVNIPLADCVRILGGQDSGSTYADIVLRLRLPRALAAILLGGTLALAGYLLQTFFHNPIAGPFILGISSGAKLVVAIAMVFSLSASSYLSSLEMIGAAFLGALASMGFVLLMARLVDRMSILIISGVMVGYICSAITDFIVTFADDADIVNLHNWSMGSFSGITWSNIPVMAVVVLASLACTFFLSKPISAYLMGEGYARSVGVNISLFRTLLVLLSSVMAACVTAFAGPVSFVGIAVPHLVKSLFRTTKPLIMIPGCFLGGAVFCQLCDLLARTAFSPTELSISTVTAIFGAPVVIWILIHRQRAKGA